MELQKGGNTVLAGTGSTVLSGLILGLDWDAGPLECDVCALVCDVNRKVLDDGYFVFWNNPESPDRCVFIRTQSVPQGRSMDRAQVLVQLDGLPQAAERIVITLSTLVERASLSALRELRLRVLEPSSGMELASYTMGQQPTVETCLIVAEVYKHRSDWKVRAVGQGYHTGLAGLGSDFGVNVG